MYFLEGDAHEWYKPLSPSSIYSLKEFHTTFYDHCKKFFLVESLFEHYCEEFESSLQHREVCSCNSEEEMKFVEKENLQESIILFSISNEKDQDSNTQVDSLPLGNDEDMKIPLEISRNREEDMDDHSDLTSVQSFSESLIHDEYGDADNELYDERMIYILESEN
jgi:hypothetical protein